MVINIRGTSGSGKTTVIRGVMEAGVTAAVYPERPGMLFAESGKPEGYSVTLPGVSRQVLVVGSYEQTCGGCDSIPTQDGICDLVRRYSKAGHVLMEGLLMSHLFSRYAALDRELQPTPYVWAFLDTPLELCLERVVARRVVRGAKKPLNPMNTTQKWHDIIRVREKCLAAGLDARVLDYRSPIAPVIDWLRHAD